MFITREEVEEARERTLKLLKKAGIVLTRKEKNEMEIVDFGLGNLEQIGVQIVVYVNTERYCVKELVLFPRQICPEHRHPPLNNNPGKQETFRCRGGKVYLYVLGKGTKKIKAKISEQRVRYFTVRNEIVLKPGQQYTIPPNTKHWFRAASDGAIVSEFSSKSVDEKDIFTYPAIKRVPGIK